MLHKMEPLTKITPMVPHALHQMSNVFIHLPERTAVAQVTYYYEQLEGNAHYSGHFRGQINISI